MSKPSYWNRPWTDDAKRFYVDDDHDDGEPLVCEDCGCELDPHFDPIAEGLCNACANAAATDTRNDHDRRVDDFYSQQQGDLGDEQIPF